MVITCFCFDNEIYSLSPTLDFTNEKHKNYTTTSFVVHEAHLCIIIKETMGNKNNISRYLQIIELLKKGPISFDAIMSRLKNTKKISNRTFLRDIQEIREIFGYHISYQKNINAYRIEDQSSKNQSQLVYYYKMIALWEEWTTYGHKIHPQTKPDHTQAFFYEVMEALKDSKHLLIGYKKFTADVTTQRVIYPLALKEFNNRWYIIAQKQDSEDLRVYALDRVTQIEPCIAMDAPKKEIDLSSFFKYSFGVVAATSIPTKVKLKFSGGQQHYIKEQPLHPTQEIKEETKAETTIDLLLWITEDFIMELMKHGPKVKVLQPKSLADEIKRRAQEIVTSYLN